MGAYGQDCAVNNTVEKGCKPLQISDFPNHWEQPFPLTFSRHCPQTFVLRRTYARAFHTSSTHNYNSGVRSEEHTSELQSRQYLVCRLLLEKNKTISNPQRW